MNCHILYITDENFIVQTGLSIQSLFVNNNAQFTIHIADTGISIENKTKLKNYIECKGHRVCFYDAFNLIRQIKSMGLDMPNDTGNVSTLVRLFIINEIPKDIKKIIYIDADTIILDDIHELYELEFNNPIAAVLDANYDFYENNILKYTGGATYFNAGVMIINIDSFIEMLGSVNVNAFLKKNYPLADQDILNYIFGRNYYILQPKYNASFKYRHSHKRNIEIWVGKKFQYDLDSLEEASNRPVIIHFTTSLLGRPWENDSLDRNTKEWRDLLKKSIWSDFCLIEKKRTFGTILGRILYKIFPEKAFCIIDHKYACFKARRKIL